MKRRIKVWHVANGFHYAGTDRAMALWARKLDRRIFDVSAFSRQDDGPRRAELRKARVRAEVLGPDPAVWERALQAGAPDVLHVHRHGEKDAAWSKFNLSARRHGVRLIVETNVFGQRRPSEGPASPDVMAFVSAFCLWRYARWPQALPQDHLGPHAVLYNPLELESLAKGAAAERRKKARAAWGLPANAVVAGRLSRPDPNKWPHWLMGAYARAAQANSRLHFLFMEAPESAEFEAEALGIAGRCRFLKASAAESDVARFYAAVDFLAHASRVGESFGYTVAEAMAFGLPVLVDSTPWADNAQVELVEHGKQGLVAARPAAFVQGLLRLAGNAKLRQRLGAAGQASAARFEASALTRSLEGIYARGLQDLGFEHPALEGIAARPTSPTEDSIAGFGSLYQYRLRNVQAGDARLDGGWAAYSRLRLYGRGWASRTLKFWRWSLFRRG